MKHLRFVAMPGSKNGMNVEGDNQSTFANYKCLNFLEINISTGDNQRFFWPGNNQIISSA